MVVTNPPGRGQKRALNKWPATSASGRFWFFSDRQQPARSGPSQKRANKLTFLLQQLLPLTPDRTERKKTVGANRKLQPTMDGQSPGST